MESDKTSGVQILKVKVMLHAIKASASYLIWPVGGIGLPALYFGFEGNLLEMSLLFILCFVMIQVLYLLACILVTKLKLVDKVAASQFSSLSDEDKGKHIANVLAGW